MRLNKFWEATKGFWSLMAVLFVVAVYVAVGTAAVAFIYNIIKFTWMILV